LLDRICKVLQGIRQISCKLPEVLDSSASLLISGDRPFDSGLFSLRFRIVRSTSANGRARNRRAEFFTDDFPPSDDSLSLEWPGAHAKQFASFFTGCYKFCAGLDRAPTPQMTPNAIKAAAPPTFTRWGLFHFVAERCCKAGVLASGTTPLWPHQRGLFVARADSPVFGPQPLRDISLRLFSTADARCIEQCLDEGAERGPDSGYLWGARNRGHCLPAGSKQQSHANVF
jgi:hypothetical protein